jgi:hypothetical protein
MGGPAFELGQGTVEIGTFANSLGKPCVDPCFEFTSRPSLFTHHFAYFQAYETSLRNDDIMEVRRLETSNKVRLGKVLSDSQSNFRETSPPLLAFH